MGGSCGVVPVILVLILTVTGTEATCTREELNTLSKCILPYKNKFSRKFGAGGLCNRDLITEDVCNDFSDIVICATKKNITSATCLPHAVRHIDRTLAISCKVTDFTEHCSEATTVDIVTGTEATCTREELSTLSQCILPYNNKLSRKFGAGGLCNRALITEDVCNDFSAIVICATKKNITSATCLPHAVRHIDRTLASSCKVTDFKELCSEATAVDIVKGSQAPCTQEEPNIFLQCILPYNNKFSRKFGTGGSCNRTLITEDVCNDFSDIVICANQKNITSSTCRPRIGVQIEDMLAISCKVTDFKELCSKAPALDVGRAAGASGVGISLRLLGAVIIVSLIAHM